MAKEEVAVRDGKPTMPDPQGIYVEHTYDICCRESQHTVAFFPQKTNPKG